MNTHTVIFSQHLKIASLKDALRDIPDTDNIHFVSNYQLFPNEKAVISGFFPSATFKCFADFLDDELMEKIDNEAYEAMSGKGLDFSNVFLYFSEITRVKNVYLEKAVSAIHNGGKKIILNVDLGIDAKVWLDAGYERRRGEYYWEPASNPSTASPKNNSNLVTSLGRRIIRFVRGFRGDCRKLVYRAERDGQTYLFYGSMNRIAYRLDMDFKRSRMASFIYACDKFLYRHFKFTLPSRAIHLSTLHEYGGCLPDKSGYSVKLIQDGYLPSNYSSKYLNYYGQHTEFYVWDRMSLGTFNYHNLKARVLPYRNKLFLPAPNFPERIKKVLCVTSGSGDWTAVKNRSDEDRMVEAFVEVARRNPDIEFVYRCHPVWVFPLHQGVNSINRVCEYIESLGLPNLRLSSNIPSAYQGGNLILSYGRSSLEEDLEGADIVFGEHSISMIDAAFDKIIFSSVNVTGRRNFFQGITDLGFPHCESVEEICTLLDGVNSEPFRRKYLQAIENYNVMTDAE